MSGIDNLQYNKEELAALLSAYQERIATLSEENEHLRSIADEARQERDIAQNEVDKLAAILKQLQRRHYGPCSERHDPDQHQLALEDLEQDLSEAQSNTGAHDNQADDETGEKPAQGRGQRKPKRNQGAMPGHLPRRDHLIPPEVTTCACCGREMPAIGEDVTEYLNYLPAILEVIRVRRPRHACSCGEDGVHQAEAPAHPITGSMATTASVVTVLVHKYADALPLYRQA